MIKSMRKEYKVFTCKNMSFGHWEHRLMMNQFLIQEGLIRKAIVEPELQLKGERFRPDFIIPLVGDPSSVKDYRFYEVDRTQKKKVNADKIERYKRLGLQFEVITKEWRKEYWKGYVYHIV